MEGIWRDGEYVPISSLEAQIVGLRKQVYKLRQDAARYCWLRDSPHSAEALRALLDGVPSVIGGHNEFDAAIDAAMLKTPNAGGQEPGAASCDRSPAP